MRGLQSGPQGEFDRNLLRLEEREQVSPSQDVLHSIVEPKKESKNAEISEIMDQTPSSEEEQEEQHARVLIVDDDQMNIEVISALLRQRAIKSDSALNGNEAIKLVQSRIEQVYRGQIASVYKVILLDYSMPEMDGPQVAIEIRRIFNESIMLD